MFLLTYSVEVKDVFSGVYGTTILIKKHEKNLHKGHKQFDKAQCNHK